MDELTQKVGAKLLQWGLAEGRVVVGVSGGADSVALLLLLHESLPLHRAQLEVVTVDHGMREDSAADTAFVCDLAERLGLSYQVVSVDAGSSEASARAARFEVFDALDTDGVALGHHADDQLETVLINLIRGTGIPGLAGMASRRGRYLRPLLDVSRVELRRWLNARGQGWREDPTNGELRFLRNHIRSELIPLIEDIRAGAGRSVLGLAARIREVQADLAERAVALGPLPWELPTLRHRALARFALVRLYPQMQHRHVDLVFSAAEAGRGVVQLPGGIRLEVTGCTLVEASL